MSGCFGPSEYDQWLEREMDRIWDADRDVDDRNYDDYPDDPWDYEDDEEDEDYEDDEDDDPW